MTDVLASRPQIVPADARDLAALSDLCLRSKAHWGYDAVFLAACRAELTLTPRDLEESSVGVIHGTTGPIAIAQVSVDGSEAEIDKLFVDPAAMGRGLGRILFDWIARTARANGATRLRIEADPDAKPFYERMGATITGTAPSGSIPGRALPRLTLDLA